jgi:cytochrome c553
MHRLSRLRVAPMMQQLTVSLMLMALVPCAFAVTSADLLREAMAATADGSHGRILYLKHCAGCHRPHPWGDGPRGIPALAGQRENYLLEQLARFVTGERAGSPLHGSAMHDTLQRPDLSRPQALADLAAYIAGAARNPEPEHAEHPPAARAKALYAQACSTCHGSDGAGNERAAVPAIGGQHYSYLLAQLDGFAAGHRAHPPLAVKGTAVNGTALNGSALNGSALNAAQQQELANYASRLAWLTSLALTDTP